MPFFAKLPTSAAPLNRSPEGGAKNFGVDRQSTGDVPKYKTPPCHGGILQHPSPNAELSLATDASNTHISGVIQQKSGDHWRPLGFFPRKLTDMESHYSTLDRESSGSLQFAIYVISVKDDLSNFGLITNHL
jgi:hypothetical protein